MHCGTNRMRTALHALLFGVAPNDGSLSCGAGMMVVCMIVLSHILTSDAHHIGILGSWAVNPPVTMALASLVLLAPLLLMR